MIQHNDLRKEAQIDEKLIKLMLLRQTISEMNAFRVKGNPQKFDAKTYTQTTDT